VFKDPDSTTTNSDRGGKPSRSITSVWRTGITEERNGETGEVEIHLDTRHDKERRAYTSSLSRCTRYSHVIEHKVHMDGRGITYAPVRRVSTERYSASHLKAHHDIALARVLVVIDDNSDEHPNVAELRKFIPTKNTEEQA